MNNKSKPAKAKTKAVAKKAGVGIPPLPPTAIQQLQSSNATERALGLATILGAVMPQLPSTFDYRMENQNRVINQFDYVFMALGSTAGFIDWAAQDPDKFYPLWAKTNGPQNNAVLQAHGPLTIVTNVPDSPLDTTKPVVVDAETGDVS